MIRSGKEILESNIGSWDYDYEGVEKAIDSQLAEILAVLKPIAEIINDNPLSIASEKLVRFLNLVAELEAVNEKDNISHPLSVHI